MQPIAKKKIVKSEYDIQAEKFLTETETSLKVTFSHTGQMPFDDKDTYRDIYNIVLQNKRHTYAFQFGNSIAHSGDVLLYCTTKDRKFVNVGFGRNGVCYPITQTRLVRSSKEIVDREKFEKVGFNGDRYGNHFLENKNFAIPTAYSVLACLTKYDPYDFENFCSEYGYDTDSKKAESTYFAVQKEYKNVLRLFGEHMEQLTEIQ